MGHYTGVALRLKVNKGATPVALAFFDRFFLEADPKGAIEALAGGAGITLAGLGLFTTDTTELLDKLDYLSLMVNGYSAYLESWCWRVKEEYDEYWLYESRASCKFPRTDLIQQIFNYLVPALVYENGEVLYREIYESGSQETILAIVDGEVGNYEGYLYLEGEDDPDHPTNGETEVGYGSEAWELLRTQRLDEFTPPWNLYELRGLQNDREKQKKGRDSSFAGYLGCND